MIQDSFIVSSPKNNAIAIHVTPGHFTTNSSHISHYLDMSELKSNMAVARDVARQLAIPYLTSTLVDTVVCMEGTEIIGAFLAEELLQEGSMVMNSGGEIRIVTPMSNVNGQLVFTKSAYAHIRGKHILLLVASVSSGKTVARAMECLEYYGGQLAGISALFAAGADVQAHAIYALFTEEDIPGYEYSRPSKCRQCEAKIPLDAIINSFGYMDLPQEG